MKTPEYVRRRFKSRSTGSQKKMTKIVENVRCLRRFSRKIREFRLITVILVRATEDIRKYCKEEEGDLIMDHGSGS